MTACKTESCTTLNDSFDHYIKNYIGYNDDVHYTTKEGDITYLADEKTIFTGAHINIITISVIEELRGKGLFTRLLTHIATYKTIEKITIMSIQNSRLDAYLGRLKTLDRPWISFKCEDFDDRVWTREGKEGGSTEVRSEGFFFRGSCDLDCRIVERKFSYLPYLEQVRSYKRAEWKVEYAMKNSIEDRMFPSLVCTRKGKDGRKIEWEIITDFKCIIDCMIRSCDDKLDKYMDRPPLNDFEMEEYSELMKKINSDHGWEVVVFKHVDGEPDEM